MNWLKSLIFYLFLLILKVGAEISEKDDSQEILTVPSTSLPIVLQLSKSLPVGNELTQPTVDKNNNDIKEHTNYQSISNDIEVFNDKLGPRLENQDEEAEAEAQEGTGEESEVGAEPEAEPEAEPVAEPEPEAEPQADETEPEAEPEPEPAAEPVEETEAETVPEPEGEPEEPKEEETPPEPAAGDAPESADEPEPEPQPETEPEEVAAADPTETVDAANEDSEMPNDEPAKEEEDQKDIENASPATHAEDAATKDVKDHQVSCFICTSVEDLKCNMKATRQASCPKVSDGDSGKHNGCYTLYKADTNINHAWLCGRIGRRGS
ncbi:protein TsetseEP-like [Lucilia sericata]|uniref:protein TsetseEP-like n=1 Tax=Lucilia sericata TaxID=13632 RepID=UPI0018A7F808|nr:protein TsetseEP-like [Lucilia sericata]